MRWILGYFGMRAERLSGLGKWGLEDGEGSWSRAAMLLRFFSGGGEIEGLGLLEGGRWRVKSGIGRLLWWWKIELGTKSWRRRMAGERF